MSPSQMSDPLGASPLDSLTPASLTFPPPRTGAGMEMTRDTRRGSRKGREAMVERRHGRVGPLKELWHPEQLTCDGRGWEVPCWWHAPGARRISSLALYACRQHSLHGWPLVCAFRRGREERQFLSALCFSFWQGGGGSTLHCHHNDLEVLCTYGNTQTSTSRMLREYLVYDTP